MIFYIVIKNILIYELYRENSSLTISIYIYLIDFKYLSKHIKPFQLLAIPTTYAPQFIEEKCYSLLASMESRWIFL
ncbi:unnamed protein product [Paramecium sonneborni]|uniref:Uncharacterized protein n=1 Tax=Paramecium sonneborni TaxID=65129 RepID=A0A8S1RRB1_9CILI|nr:unnamed protein product [Paramecium sonneborni]